jgi:hypothetical protein
MMKWAILRGDKKLAQKMKNTFDWTRRYSSSWGWVPDDLGADGFCETCSLVDALQMAGLIAQHVDPSYYEIIERYARNQLIENQITTPELILPKEDSSQKHAVTQSLYGSWTSHGRPNSLDGGFDGIIEGCCLGSGIRGCCLVWESIIQKQTDEVLVNFALSRNSPWLEVVSYQPYQGRLDINIHDASRVSV